MCYGILIQYLVNFKHIRCSIVMLRECGFRADRDVIGSINIWLKVLEGCAGMCVTPRTLQWRVGPDRAGDKT